MRRGHLRLGSPDHQGYPGAALKDQPGAEADDRGGHPPDGGGKADLQPGGLHQGWPEHGYREAGGAFRGA